MDQLAYILPLGLMVAGHVTPIDHQYYAPKSAIGSQGERSGGPDLYALANGTIVQITHRTESVGTRQVIQNYDRFRVVIEHTCTFWSYYDEMTSLSADILSQISLSGASQNLQTRIAVKEGQVIGTAQTVDLGVADTQKPLTGLWCLKATSANPGKSIPSIRWSILRPPSAKNFRR
jgi:hypothetical protein